MIIRAVALGWVAIGLAAAGESEALAISERIAARHLPFGTVLDPMLEGDTLVGYTRCGDSAIWSGHYLAAESYRYAVTRTPESLAAVQRAIDGVWLLVEVTGRNLLARCAVPVDSPHAPGILAEERHHGSYQGSANGTSFWWVGNTSRDQYSGVFFGLAVAWDLVDDARIRTTVLDLVSRLLWKLRADDWAVRMPDGSIPTTFGIRADQQLALLQIGRKVNPGQFSKPYRDLRFWLAASVPAPIAVDVADDHSSYFKFNLDTINLFALLRYEEDGVPDWFYQRAYDLLRRTTDDHGNPHFNMIDRALRGPNARRDEETRRLLDEWLTRDARDPFVDLRAEYRSCNHQDRACEAIPVARRVHTDFLWQRSPFLLFGGGSGRVEGAGIDYILPYWMARHYGVISRPGS
jgi:hypothetical protein